MLLRVDFIQRAVDETILPGWSSGLLHTYVVHLMSLNGGLNRRCDLHWFPASLVSPTPSDQR